MKATFEKKEGRWSFADSGHRVAHFFGKSAWCDRPIVEESALLGLPLGRDSNLDRPQNLLDLDHDAAVELYRLVRDGDSPQTVVDGFLEAVTRRAGDTISHVVLKAADQVILFDHLVQLIPDAKTIAITRDGRDAAISAMHYKRMVKDKPWFTGTADYWS